LQAGGLSCKRKEVAYSAWAVIRSYLERIVNLGSFILVETTLLFAKVEAISYSPGPTVFI